MTKSCAGGVGEVLTGNERMSIGPWRRRRPPASPGVVCGQGGGSILAFLPGMQNFVTFIDTRPKITAPSQHLGLPGGAAGARDGTGCPVDICPILLVNLGCPRHEEKINVLVVTQLFTGLHIHSVTRRAISSVGQRQTASLRISHGMTRQHRNQPDSVRVAAH